MINQDRERSPRGVPVRWVLILLSIIIVAAIIAFAVQAFAARRVEQQFTEDLRNQTEQSASNTARTIALFGRDEIAAENWGVLQNYADELVRADGISYIAIVNPQGRAVVHTNRTLRGQRFQEPEDEDIIVASAPVVRLNRRIATVWVAMDSPE